MVQKCCVPNCRFRSDDVGWSRLSFRIYPKDDERRNKWSEVLRENFGDAAVEGILSRKHLFICDLHFDASCFYYGGTKTKLLLLRESVPTIFTKWDEPVDEVVSIKVAEILQYLERNENHPAYLDNLILQKSGYKKSAQKVEVQPLLENYDAALALSQYGFQEPHFLFSDEHFVAASDPQLANGSIGDGVVKRADSNGHGAIVNKNLMVEKTTYKRGNFAKPDCTSEKKAKNLDGAEYNGIVCPQEATGNEEILGL